MLLNCGCSRFCGDLFDAKGDFVSTTSLLKSFDGIYQRAKMINIIESGIQTENKEDLKIFAFVSTTSRPDVKSVSLRVCE